ncbi:MAG: PD-(D/E)XK nuclease family protein [Patescibacteria group bacterium]
MAIVRKSNIFDPRSQDLFKLSRTKLENFMRCPRCFYLDRRLGVSEPSMPSFTLNIAVDHLLKKEFDIHRAQGVAHPLMQQYGVDAVPFVHPQLDVWRENFVGIQYHHKPTNFIFFGAVDDIWVNPQGELHIVDYKATSKDGAVEFGDSIWHDAYKRQMEIYEWLLRHNGFEVSDISYFVYVNGKRDRKAFDGKLEFDVTVFPYEGDDGWVEGKLIEAHDCLMKDALPSAAPTCEYCQYRDAANRVFTPFQPVAKKHQAKLFE